MSNDIVKIELSAEEIREMFLVHLKAGHSEKIADVVIGNLCETEVGLRQLYFAMMGIVKPVKFKLNDRVVIDPVKLYDWNMNIDKMREEGYFVNGLLPCEIVKVRPYKARRLEVKYMYINKDTDTRQEYVQDIEEEHVNLNTPEFLDL